MTWTPMLATALLENLTNSVFLQNVVC